MPSREVYLRGVINLYFVCNKLCNFFGVYPSTVHKYILRRATPPFARARLQTPLYSFIFTGVVHVSCFVKCHPPIRSTGGDDDCETCCSPWGLILILHAFAFGFAREDLQRFAPSLWLSRDRTFHPSLSCDGILLGDLWLFSRKGSRLAFGFRAT